MYRSTTMCTLYTNCKSEEESCDVLLKTIVDERTIFYSNALEETSLCSNILSKAELNSEQIYKFAAEVNCAQQCHIKKHSPNHSVCLQ